METLSWALLRLGIAITPDQATARRQSSEVNTEPDTLGKKYGVAAKAVMELLVKRLQMTKIIGGTFYRASPLCLPQKTETIRS